MVLVADPDPERRRSRHAAFRRTALRGPCVAAASGARSPASLHLSAAGSSSEGTDVRGNLPASPHLLLLGASFVLAKLPGHVRFQIRFQRTEIIRGQRALRRAEGPKSTALMFAEAPGLLIEASFLVSSSLPSDDLCWLHKSPFPALPVSSLSYCF